MRRWRAQAHENLPHSCISGARSQRAASPLLATPGQLHLAFSTLPSSAVLADDKRRSSAPPHRFLWSVMLELCEKNWDVGQRIVTRPPPAECPPRDRASGRRWIGTGAISLRSAA